MNRVLTLACLMLVSMRAASATLDVVAIGHSGSDVATLTFTYDDAATDSAAPNPQVGFYENAIQAMTLTIQTQFDSSVFGSGSGQETTILVVNDSLPGVADLWVAQSTLAYPVGHDGGSQEESYSLVLLTQDANATTVPPFDSDALVVPPWPYAWFFAQIQVEINSYDAQGVLVQTFSWGTYPLDSLTITPSAVPLPAAGWLLPAAFAAAGLRARRRR